MRVILNLTDDQIKHLNEISIPHKVSYEELLMTAYYRDTYNPAITAGEIELAGKRQELDNFLNLLHYYMHEAIRDIEDASENEEAYETDKAMLHVFRRLAHEHLDNVVIASDLYKTFKQHYKKELKKPPNF